MATTSAPVVVLSAMATTDYSNPVGEREGRTGSREWYSDASKEKGNMKGNEGIVTPCVVQGNTNGEDDGGRKD